MHTIVLTVHIAGLTGAATGFSFFSRSVRVSTSCKSRAHMAVESKGVSVLGKSLGGDFSNPVYEIM